MKKCIMLVFILAVGMFSIVGCGDKTAKSDVSDADGAVTDATSGIPQEPQRAFR